MPWGGLLKAEPTVNSTGEPFATVSRVIVVPEEVHTNTSEVPAVLNSPLIPSRNFSAIWVAGTDWPVRAPISTLFAPTAEARAPTRSLNNINFLRSSLSFTLIIIPDTSVGASVSVPNTFNTTFAPLAGLLVALTPVIVLCILTPLQVSATYIAAATKPLFFSGLTKSSLRGVG